MGKYTHLIANLPRSYGEIDEDPSSGEKVRAVKKSILESIPDPKNELSSEALEDLVGEIEAMQKVVNDALIQGLSGRRNAATAARMYRNVRIVRNSYKEQERVNKIIKAAYEQILVETYETEGMTNLKLGDFIGGSIRYEEQPHAKVVDKEANRKWAIASGLENSLALAWGTVNAIAKKALENGEPEPDGTELTKRVKVVYTPDK